MNRLALALFSLASSAVLAGPAALPGAREPQQQAAAAPQIERNEHALAEAIAKKDDLATGKLVADEFTFSDAAGTLSKAEWSRGRPHGFNAVQTRKCAVQQWEKAALARCEIELVGRRDPQSTMVQHAWMRISDLWIERAGQWLLVARHQFPEKKPSRPAH